MRLRLAGESTSFVQFVAFMSQDSASEHGLLKDIVGEFQGEEDKVMVDYCAFYEQYGKHTPCGWPAMTHKNATGEDVPITCAALCAAGSTLPVAKLIVHMTAWLKDYANMPACSIVFESEPKDMGRMFEARRMNCVCAKEDEAQKLMQCLLTSMEAVNKKIKHDKASTFLGSCLRKAPYIFAKIVDLVKSEVGAMTESLIKLYNAVDSLADFNKALDNENIDAKLSSLLCNDVSLQKLYQFFACGLDRFMGLKQVLLSLLAAMRSCETLPDTAEMFQAVSADSRALIQKIVEFSDAPKSGDSVTLTSMSTLVGNATVAQACTRELKTGETRAVLVNKAWTGIKKRGWKIHPTLHQRCTDLLNGKASKPAAK